MSSDQLHETLERLDDELDAKIARIDTGGSFVFSIMLIGLLAATVADPGFAPSLGCVAALSVHRGIQIRRDRVRREAVRAYYKLTGESELPE